MTLRWKFGFITFLLLLAVTQPLAARQQSVEQEITGILQQMYEAEQRRDLDFVLPHLTTDFTEVAGDGGIYHREDIIREWPNVKLMRFKISGFVFRQLSANVAYLSYRLDMNAQYKDQPFPASERVTTIWVMQQGQWRVCFEQGTVIPTAEKSAAK
jgi:hypothetical protein